MTGATNRPRLLAVALIAVAVLVGLVGGVALERWVLRRPAAAAVPGGPAVEGTAGVAGARGGERFRARYLHQLSERLDLSPTQQARIDSLLEAQQRRTRAVMHRTGPALRTIDTETRTAIRAILTPAQWERFDRMRQERLERRRGGERMPRGERRRED